MQHPPSNAVTDSTQRRRLVPVAPLQRRTPHAFLIGGALLIASFVAPLGLAVVTDDAWLTGILAVGLAVVSVAAGLLGLYPSAKRHAQALAVAGAASGAVAGATGLGLLALAGLWFAVNEVIGIAFPVTMGTFAALAFVMASGYALGFLAYGIVGLSTDGLPTRAAQLLAGGGALLLIPLTGELLRRGLGLGPPPWILLPVLAVVAVDTLAIGISLRSTASSSDGVGR